MSTFFWQSLPVLVSSFSRLPKINLKTWAHLSLKNTKNPEALIFFNNSSVSKLSTAPFTSHKEKENALFYLLTASVYQEFHLGPQSSQVIHFSIKPTAFLSFTTHNKKLYSQQFHVFTFNQPLNSTFNVFQTYSENKKRTECHKILENCSFMMQNFTNHSATLPNGYIGFIGTPATIEKPFHNHVKNLNNLVHSIFQ